MSKFKKPINPEYDQINHLHLRDGGLAITAKAASQAKANQA